MLPELIVPGNSLEGGGGKGGSGSAVEARLLCEEGAYKARLGGSCLPSILSFLTANSHSCILCVA